MNIDYTFFNRCKDDVVYFAEKLCLKPLNIQSLTENQKETLRYLSSERRAHISWERQCGGSTMLVIFSVWLFLFHEEPYVLYMSPSVNESREKFKKALEIMNFIFDEQFLKDGLLKELGRSKLTTIDGRTLDFRTENIGTTCSVLIIDDFGRCAHDSAVGAMLTFPKNSRMVVGFSDRKELEEIWKKVIDDYPIKITERRRDSII